MNIQEVIDAIKDEWIKKLEQIREEIIDKSFSVVNPNDTYEYINVIDLGSLGEIIDKALKEQNK